MLNPKIMLDLDRAAKQVSASNASPNRSGSFWGWLRFLFGKQD